MGKVSDYITGLEGKENIDPLVVASTLLELHNEEMGIAEGKIASLTQSNTEHESLIAERNKEITGLKAKNWDLVNRIPADNQEHREQESARDEAAKNATFDDFFKEE